MHYLLHRRVHKICCKNFESECIRVIPSKSSEFYCNSDSIGCKDTEYTGIKTMKKIKTFNFLSSNFLELRDQQDKRLHVNRLINKFGTKATEKTRQEKTTNLKRG